MTLHADEILYLDDLSHKIELCSTDNVKFTKNICLRAPLHQDLRKRCPHYNSEMSETLGDAIDMDDGSEVCLQPVLLFCSTPNDVEEFILGRCHESRSILGLIYGT
jgi:hypothetical protein